MAPKHPVNHHQMVKKKHNFLPPKQTEDYTKKKGFNYLAYALQYHTRMSIFYFDFTGHWATLNNEELFNAPRDVYQSEKNEVLKQYEVRLKQVKNTQYFLKRAGVNDVLSHKNGKQFDRLCISSFNYCYLQREKFEI